MKRLIPAAVLLSLALMLTSCSASNDTTPERVSGGQTKVAASAKGGSADKGVNAYEGDFNISYNGVRIDLDAEVEPIVKAIGKDYMYTEKPSCAYVGTDYSYNYTSFIIYGQKTDGKVLVSVLEIRDNTVDCGGIKVGQTFDDVKKVYGEPSTDLELSILYVKDGKVLKFASDGTGKVIQIVYAHENAD